MMVAVAHRRLMVVKFFIKKKARLRGFDLVSCF